MNVRDATSLFTTTTTKKRHPTISYQWYFKVGSCLKCMTQENLDIRNCCN